MRCRFDRIDDFFVLLNGAGINYLVLRNHENLHDPEIYVDGHADIDLLCDSPQSIVELTGALPIVPSQSRTNDDGIHYRIYVHNKPVQLDLRHVGDGYYCTKWENDLLERKVEKNGFYVMNDEDYFYTLAYHAIIQKRSLSHEYLNRLSHMAEGLSLQVDHYDQSSFLHLLQEYMSSHGYRFTYTQDYMVPNRFHLVDHQMIDRDATLCLKHCLFDLKNKVIEMLVKIKHLVKR